MIKDFVRKGFVSLVGAGPGGSELLTLKACDRIRQADVVIYDALVSQDILAMIPGSTEKIYVGKVGGGPRMPQAEIDRLLTQHGKEKNVVRLKGGDPFVFGRGGEEALALAKAGIDFEIVPGISAAIAVPAYAGIPVTCRGYNTMVTFITGHPAPSGSNHDEAADNEQGSETQGSETQGIAIDWQALASPQHTIVFLMGIQNIAANMASLMRVGRDPQTPVAVIQWGTRPQQKTWVTTVATAAQTVQENNITRPCVIVVGANVSLRESLNWFEKLPLFGRRIMITRPRHQTHELAQLVSAQGGEPLPFPTVVIEALPVDENLRCVMQQGWDWVVFTSANAIEIFFSVLKRARLDARLLGRAKLATLGPATARLLANHHLQVDLIPQQFHAEGLVAALTATSSEPQRLLLLGAQDGRPTVSQELKSRGWTVESLALYATKAPLLAPHALHDFLQHENPDVITFTSASAVKNFFSLLGQERALCHKNVFAVLGPVTLAALAAEGCQAKIVAPQATMTDLIEAITAHLAY